jgi:hypothetical protein
MGRCAPTALESIDPESIDPESIDLEISDLL